MKRLTGCLKIVGIGLIVVLILGAGFFFVEARTSIIPDNINMSSDGMGSMAGTFNAGTPSANATPITSLVAPADSSAPVKSFTLTAQERFRVLICGFSKAIWWSSR